MDTPEMINDEETVRGLQSLRLFAVDPRNWYVEGGPVPGCDPRHVRDLLVTAPSNDEKFHYRVVFSITVHEGVAYRHTSVSANDGDAIPAQVPVESFCKLLGYEGTYADWGVGESELHRNVRVVIQPVGPAGAPC